MDFTSYLVLESLVNYHIFGVPENILVDTRTLFGRTIFITNQEVCVTKAQIYPLEKLIGPPNIATSVLEVPSLQPFLNTRSQIERSNSRRRS